MNEFVAQSQPFKSILMIIGCLFFIVMGFWMSGLAGYLLAANGMIIADATSSSARFPVWLVKPTGWVSLIFFTACAIGWTKRLFSNEAHIRINATGIAVPSKINRHIYWNEISHIKTWSGNGQTMMVFKLHDPSILQNAFWRQPLDNANRKFIGGDLVVSMTGTNRTIDQALQAIAYYQPKH